MSKIVSFKTTKDEMQKINAIAHRAVAMASVHGVPYTVMEAHMDLSACHANGCPMDFDKLASADDFNFAHDVFGIRRHINRITGELEDCFVPRCALSDKDAARHNPLKSA